MIHTRLPSTLGVLLRAVAVIFSIEFLLMILGLPLLKSDSELVGGLLDAGNLAVWSSPFLWWIVVRPFRRAAVAEAQRFSDLVEGAPSSMVCVSESGQIVFVNTLAEKMFGYTRAELLGQPVEMLMPQTYAAQHAVSRRSYQAAPRIADMTNSTGQRKGGQQFPVNVRLGYIRQADGGLVVAIVQDVTEQRRNREELECANSQLRESLQQREQRSREIALLIEMGELLQACKNQEEADEVIGSYSARLFPGGYGAVCLISQARDMVEPMVSWGNPLTPQQPFQPDDCWALRRGKAYLVSDSGPVPCHHMHAATGGSLCIPLAAQGETLGVLHLRCAPTEPSFSAAQQSLAAAVAGQLAVTLASLRLRTSLWNQSVRDPLTGLYNRRYMEESLERELRRAERRHTSVAVTIMDIDYFKQFNDTFGHSGGDVALRSVAGLIRTMVRGEDIPCRYGGEEFVIIFPDMDLQTALGRAEQLRERCRRLNLGDGKGASRSITLSAGIAVFPLHGKSGESVLHAADMALYQAKRSGRDRALAASVAAGAP